MLPQRSKNASASPKISFYHICAPAYADHGTSPRTNHQSILSLLKAKTIENRYVAVLQLNLKVNQLLTDFVSLS